MMDFVNSSVDAYLADNGVSYNGWTIAAVDDGGDATVVAAGRGLVATKDYEPGDVLFVDTPLIVSPRVTGPASPPPVCPVCYTTATALAGCPGGCGLPVCGGPCARHPGHSDECRYVRSMGPKTGAGRWSAGLYNGIVAVRALTVLKDGPYACFLDVLQKKSTDMPVFEVEELKKNINMKLTEDDERIMTVACKIMDANCFETITYRRDKLISLKGLYPVASFMNHSCVPNTMHNFDGTFKMTVKASLPIHKGQEITTTYTHLIWPTAIRQNHLLTSKQFVCTCIRCCDPKEFGTQLSALNCIIQNCDGCIFPINPLDKTSFWQCSLCAKLVTHVEIKSFYKNIESLMNSINVFCPKTLRTILDAFNIRKDGPYVVDLRLKFIWKSKNTSLNLEQLLYKEKSCVELLDLIHKLGLGQCRLLGLISLELSKVIEEKVSRFNWNTKTLNIFNNQIILLRQKSTAILDGDDNTKISVDDNN